MLNVRKMVARLPAQDLDRARKWYAEKLGFEAAEERPGGLRYLIGSCEFALYSSAGRSDGSFTQLGFEVADLRAAVRELSSRGVVFEDYDEGPLQTDQGVATINGNYPSKGTGEYGAWFRDSEGNMLGLAQPF
jgi:catechol 2,3-dioxygenase-like lactoylglutathione lyase family enzyme